MNSNTTKNRKEERKERRKEVQRKMLLSPSSIDPLHCALSFGHCLSFPNVGSSGEGEGRNLGAGARTPGLEWGFGFGGGLAPKMGGSTEVSKHLGSGL